MVTAVRIIPTMAYKYHNNIHHSNHWHLSPVAKCGDQAVRSTVPTSRRQNSHTLAQWLSTEIKQSGRPFATIRRVDFKLEVRILEDSQFFFGNFCQSLPFCPSLSISLYRILFLLLSHSCSAEKEFLWYFAHTWLARVAKRHTQHTPAFALVH